MYISRKNEDAQNAFEVRITDPGINIGGFSFSTKHAESISIAAQANGFGLIYRKTVS